MRLSRVLPVALLTLSLFVSNIAFAPPLSAQSNNDEDAIDAELIGYQPDVEPLLEADWVNPVTQFDLDPANLEPLPDFDVSTLHDSTVFAAGVDRVAVIDEDLEPYILRHRQVLQAIATLERMANENAEELAALRPRVDDLLARIAHERENEARLVEEIDIRKRAIAEFAIQTFIGDGELETALSIPDTGLGETRVINDEIRDDQLLQIVQREAEFAQRQRRRAGLEGDLSGVRSDIEQLRLERVALIERRREAELIPPHTAAAYQVALHDRLPEFIEGTDIPLVALNAYVVAERVLAQERATCGLEWWMLAGIGRIESFHGHFGDSTLNVNGHTTEAIRGPALDGRILSGSEFLVDETDAPAPTGRTETQAVTTAPAAESEAPAPDPAPAPAPAAPPAALASTDNTAAPSGPDSANNPGSDGDATVGPGEPPAPLIKRLALIRDSDNGVLDGDTTFDRAVGPMQFIPSTWRLFESDSNADGQNDPQNIYDASLASARYLCASTATMATITGRQQGYFAYNHDVEYTANVESSSQRYRSRIDIPTDEFGTVSALGIADEERNSEIEEASTPSGFMGLLDW